MEKETTIKVKTDTRDELMMIKIKTKAKSLDQVIRKDILKFKKTNNNQPSKKEDE